MLTIHREFNLELHRAKNEIHKSGILSWMQESFLPCEIPFMQDNVRILKKNTW